MGRPLGALFGALNSRQSRLDLLSSLLLGKFRLLLGAEGLGFSVEKCLVAGAVGEFGLLSGVEGGLLGVLASDFDLLLGSGEVIISETVIEPDDEDPRRKDAGDETGDEQRPDDP
jgi:hypothetical protein